MRVSRLMLLAGTALGAQTQITIAQAPPPGTLPQGGQVIAGEARIAAPAPNRLEITQGSDRAVIGWQSFSIGSNASVDIRQPGAGSISVQQVRGDDPSRVFGQLSSNGRVVIANPNGVWFGPDARVDAAGVAAAAGRMSGDAIGRFMEDGQVRLDQQAAAGAAVVNEGRIAVSQGGLAALLGPTARNAGTIEARLGRVQIAGGSAATVDFDGDGLIAIRAAPGALAENTGRISADGGRVRMTVAEARGVLAGAVNMGGVVEARSVGTDAGGITLGGVDAEGPTVTLTGRVDVSGRRGGTVTVVGEHVAMRAGARIEASGAEGGGTVRLGGAARGAAGTRRALTAEVAEGAVIAADATVSGDGGSVVLWAEEAARFAGTITARGAGAGSGGFAEVSGRLALDYAGTADLRAPSGNWGRLLLDPTVLNVVASGGLGTVAGLPPGGTVGVNASAVVSALAMADVELRASKTVSVKAPLAWTGGTLILVAETEDVVVAGAVTSAGAGGLVVFAGRDASFTGAVTMAGGGVSVSAGRDALVMNALSLSGTAPLTLQAGRHVSLGGPVTLSGSGGATLKAARDVTLANSVTASGSSSLTVLADADGSGNGAANLHGMITLSGGALLARGASVHAGGDGDIRIGTATGAITLAASTGDVRIESASKAHTTRVESDSGPITITAGADVLVRGSHGDGTWSRVLTGGAVEVVAGRDLALRAGTGAGDSSARVGGGTMVVTATRDVIVGTGSGNSPDAGQGPAGISLEATAGGQKITAGRHILVRAGGQRAEAAIRSAGDQTVTAAGHIDLFAAGSAAGITAAGTQAITAKGAIGLSGSNTGAFGATILNTGGDQTVTAGQLLDLDARKGGALVRNTTGSQAVTAGSLRLAAGPSGPAGIVNANGTQAVTATGGLIALTAAPGAPAQIANTGGAQKVSAATTLTLTGAVGAGSASITNGAGGQAVTATDGITLTGGAPGPAGAGGAAFATAAGGPQSVTTTGTLTLAAGPGAAPLGLSDAAPTGAPTPGSASIQSVPGTAPGVAAGAADQVVTAAAIAFTGPAGAAAIGLRDWRAIDAGPAAAPRYQSVLAGGVELSVAGAAAVFALPPPPGPAPAPPGGTAAAVAGVVDAGGNALKLVTAPTFPRPVSETLAAGTGGFTPAGLTETEGFRPASVVVEGEDPAAAFANTVLATRIEGLLPPPVPYFSGYVAPPPVRAAWP